MIDNEKVISSFKEKIDNIDKNDIRQLTLNFSFPFIKIFQNFDEKDINKIFSTLFLEIQKEKRDDFPYSLAYQEKLEINFCIKNIKFCKLINIGIFVTVLVNKY